MPIIPGGEMVAGGARKEIKLLVVDEQADHFEQIRTFADMYSSQFVIECKLAHDKDEANEVMASWNPSVVLVDVHLISDAFNLIQEISHKGASVLAVSEARIPRLAETAQTYGAVGCLTKSDNPDNVEHLVGYIASIATSSIVSH
jgi:DNA-binding NarL/FixJ family response regulator